MATAERTPAPTEAARFLARTSSLFFLGGVAVTPFMQPFSFKLLGSVVQPSDALFALAGLAWAPALLLGGVTLRRGRSLLFFGLFLGAALLTTAVAPHRSPGRVVIELYLVGLGFLAYQSVRDLDDVRRTWLVWTGTATFTAAAILVSSLLFYAIGLKDPEVNPILWKAGSLPVGNYPRVRGFFLNGNMTGNYLALSACLAFGLAAFSERHRRFAFWAGLAICAAALPTLSSALGGLAIAIGLFAWHLQTATQKNKPLKALLPLGALFALLLGLFTAGYPKQTEAGMVIEASPRWLTWNSSFGSFLKHPLFGNGLGALLADVYYSAPRGVREHLTDPHNAWLSVSGQMGVIGLAAFIAMLAWLARGTRPWATSPDPKAIVRTALFGAWIVIVYQAFSCSLEDMRHVWLIFGMLAGAIDPEKSMADGRPRGDPAF
jgi:O-antigen ligase